MTNSTLIIILLIICASGLFGMVYWITLTTATNRKKIKFLEKQVRLLARIAKKVGVDAEDVDSVVGGPRKFKRGEHAQS